MYVAWVARGYVNPTLCRCFGHSPLHNAMIHSFLIYQIPPPSPPICCINSPWNGVHASPCLRYLLKRRPPSPSPLGLDNCTMTQSHLAMHDCPGNICLLQVQPDTINVCSRKLSYTPALFSVDSSPPTSADSGVLRPPYNIKSLCIKSFQNKGVLMNITTFGRLCQSKTQNFASQK